MGVAGSITKILQDFDVFRGLELLCPLLEQVQESRVNNISTFQNKTE